MFIKGKVWYVIDVRMYTASVWLWDLFAVDRGEPTRVTMSLSRVSKGWAQDLLLKGEWRTGAHPHTCHHWEGKWLAQKQVNQLWHTLIKNKTWISLRKTGIASISSLLWMNVNNPKYSTPSVPGSMIRKMTPDICGMIQFWFSCWCNSETLAENICAKRQRPRNSQRLLLFEVHMLWIKL